MTTATVTRTEPAKAFNVHSPKNLITENYEYIHSFDNQTPWVLLGGDWAMEISRKLAANPSDRGSHRCHHCGVNIRYVAILRHTPTGDLIAVGETCLENRFDRATADFQRMRKQAQLDREQQRIKNGVAAFVQDNPDLAFLATGKLPESISWNSFIQDLSRKLRQYGDLSVAQVNAARRTMEKTTASQAAREQQKAAEALAPVADVVEGRIKISGVILGFKVVESDYGTVTKAIVADDRGFRVFGTAPQAGEKGDHVTFTATVERSRNDPYFGFYKRPYGGVVDKIS